MDEATFQKELSKYKIVRGSDYCKSRIHKSSAKSDAKSTRSSSQPTHTGHGSSSSSSRHEVQSTIPGTDFWEMLAAATGSILSPAETTKFIESLKAEHEKVSGRLSLYDLEAMASGQC